MLVSSSVFSFKKIRVAICTFLLIVLISLSLPSQILERSLVKEAAAEFDFTPPTVNSLTISPSQVSLGGSFTVSFSVSDAGGSGLLRVELWRTTDIAGVPNPLGWAEVKRVSASGNSYSSSFSNAPSATGVYWYGIHVVDNAGNTGHEASPVQGTVGVVDTTLPTVNSLTINPGQVSLGNSFTISVSVSDTGGSGLLRVELWRTIDILGVPDPLGWAEVKRVSAYGNSYSSSFTDAPSSNGVYWYGIHVVDNAGNTGHEVSAVKGTVGVIDTTGPTVDSLTINPVQVSLGGSFTISFSVSDAGGSGLLRVELWRTIDILGVPDPLGWAEVKRVSASGNSYSSSFNDAPSANGVYWYGIHVVDNAGNTGHEVSAVKGTAGVVDTTLPTVDSLTISPSQVGLGGSFTISFSVSDAGGSGLLRVELWRTTDIVGVPNLLGWAEIKRISAYGNSYSSSFTDAPSSNGVYWYGIHVVDNAGNTGHEVSAVKGTVGATPTPVSPIDLSKKIRLVFSVGERYYPVPGLYFDGDHDITNNYQNYQMEDISTHLADRNADGVRDSPAYVYAVKSNGMIVVEYWLYYAFDSNMGHEHDFEYIFVWCDGMTGQIKRIALNQHRWTNNYEFASDPSTVYVAVEEGGHSMILLDRNSDGTFTIRKPDNCKVLSWAQIDKFGTHNQNSVVTSIYPLAVYDGMNPMEGFGNDALLRTGANYKLYDPLVILSLQGPEFYMESIDTALNTPILLASGKPFAVNFGNVSLPFYIEAPWKRVEFNDPEIQWEKVSFEWWCLKTSVKTVATIVGITMIKDLLVKLAFGTIQTVLMAYFDPVEATISNSAEQILGYKNGLLVNEIPGGMIFFNNQELAVFMIIGPTDDLRYDIKSIGQGNYNMTLVLCDKDGKQTVFEANTIPVTSSSRHSYQIDWVSLSEGKQGASMLIDTNGDGTYERTITAGNSLEGSELALPWWSNLWWVVAAAFLVSVGTICIVYYRISRNRKQKAR